MKVKTLNENLTKALSGIKESQVSICDVVVNRKPLLEALKVNKQFGEITIETGLTSWQQLDDKGIVEPHPNIIDKPCLRISLDHTVLTLLDQYNSNMPQSIAILNFANKSKAQGIAIDSQLLLQSLNFAIPCMASEDARPVLHGILFDCGDNTIKLAGADGFRLAVCAIPAQGIPESKSIISSNDINRLVTFIKSSGKGKTYPELLIEILDKAVKFHTDNGSIEFGTVDGTYPQYGLLIPHENLINIDFVASELLQAANSLKNICNNGAGIIRLVFNHNTNNIEVSAKSEEYGESSGKVDAKVQSDCKIAVGYKYLVSLLKQYKDSIITVQITNEQSPLLFTLPDGKIQVIMPMFVQWDNS